MGGIIILHFFTNLFRNKEQRAVSNSFESSLRESVNTSYISRTDALSIPAVATAVSFITSTVAALPIRLYRKENSCIQEVVNDYRLRLLNTDTGDVLDAVQMKAAFIADYLLDGNGYIYLEKNGNRIESMYYIDSTYVSVTSNTDKIHKKSRIYLNGKKYPDTDVMRITRDSVDGSTGTGIPQQNALLLNSMLSALKYENSSVQNGAKRGFLRLSDRNTTLSPEAVAQIRKNWQRLQSTDGGGEVVFLNNGLEFVPVQLTAAEQQINESKAKNSELVYNLFGLTSELFTPTTATNDVYIRTVKTAILPIIAAVNNALNKYMLLEKEKETLYFAIDENELLRSTITERYTAYDLAIKTGWLQVDEVRRMEQLPPLGLNFVKLTQSDVLYDPSTNNIFSANTAKTMHVGGDANEQQNENSTS